MPLPYKEHISLWIYSDLKYIAPWEPNEIQISPVAMDHIVDLKQNTNGATGLRKIVVSAYLVPVEIGENNPTAYKLKYIIHEIHPTV